MTHHYQELTSNGRGGWSCLTKWPPNYYLHGINTGDDLCETLWSDYVHFDTVYGFRYYAPQPATRIQVNHVIHAHGSDYRIAYIDRTPTSEPGVIATLYLIPLGQRMTYSASLYSSGQIGRLHRSWPNLAPS